MHIRSQTCHIHRALGDVTITVGKQAFDPQATPVSADQVVAAPVLMFKASGSFQQSVEISITVFESLIALLYGDGGARRLHDGRRLLETTIQELKQHWFNTNTQVCMYACIYHICFIFHCSVLCMYVCVYALM